MPLLSMSSKIIEKELSGLKSRVSKLEALATQQSSQAWREIIGTSDGDRLDRDAARLGAAWRKRENKRR